MTGKRLKPLGHTGVHSSFTRMNSGVSAEVVINFLYNETF